METVYLESCLRIEEVNTCTLNFLVYAFAVMIFWFEIWKHLLSYSYHSKIARGTSIKIAY